MHIPPPEVRDSAYSGYISGSLEDSVACFSANTGLVAATREF